MTKKKWTVPRIIAVSLIIIVVVLAIITGFGYFEWMYR